MSLAALLKDIRACRACADDLPHEPRPVLRASSSAKVLIVGQAPGTRVHESGIPFTDPSGERLRAWMGVSEDEFYDEAKVAIVPMGFCFPGLDAKGGDKPPLKRCAELWRDAVMAQLSSVALTLVIGQYAQAWHLGKQRKKSLTATVEAWQDYGPELIPLPHPSWRNNGWIKRHPWFESDLVPHLQARIDRLLRGEHRGVFQSGS